MTFNLSISRIMTKVELQKLLNHIFVKYYYNFAEYPLMIKLETNPVGCSINIKFDKNIDYAVDGFFQTYLGFLFVDIKKEEEMKVTITLGYPSR